MRAARPRAQKVQALVFVGDAMEEKIDDLCAAAGELGLLGVPAFMFQEGDDAVAEQAFREIARLSRGAYCRFDPGAAHELAELLRAVAAYAAGGMKALADLSARHNGGAVEAAGADEIAMPTLIFGIVVLVLVLWALNGYCQGRSQNAGASCCGRPAASGALAGAAFLVFRGHFEVAVPLGLFGLGPARAGCRSPRPALFQRTQKTPGQVSRVRSPSSRWSSITTPARCAARILAGPHAGRDARRARLPTLLGLLAEIDEESRALLTAYLDRREPGWREHAQGGAAAGPGRLRAAAK